MSVIGNDDKTNVDNSLDIEAVAVLKKLSLAPKAGSKRSKADILEQTMNESKAGIADRVEWKVSRLNN